MDYYLITEGYNGNFFLGAFNLNPLKLPENFEKLNLSRKFNL